MLLLLGWAALPIADDGLWRRFVQFKLRVNLLDLRCLLFERGSKDFHFPLLLGDGGFQFLDLLAQL